MSTSRKALESLELSAMTQAIQRDKRENLGLWERRTAIDVMPKELISWLANIEDETRAWM